MRIATIYLDSSVVSHLDAPDVPDAMMYTKVLWHMLLSRDYAPAVSSIMLEEILRAPEPKRSYMLQKIDELACRPIYETDESLSLVDAYIDYKVLTDKRRDDLRHIALASVSNLDYIASWNFRHFVNIRTINRVKAVNAAMGYRNIEILPPSMLVETEEAH